MILICDTETSGKLNFKAPDGGEGQPHLVQLGAILLAEPEFTPMQELSLIVKPVGFEIPSEAAGVHGITTKDALEHGVQLEVVLNLLSQLVKMSRQIVMFNVAFDRRVLNGEYLRSGIASPFDAECKVPFYDVMLEATDHCKIPGNYGRWKWPKLSEAHEFFFHEPFVGAHSALGDCKATFRVYRKLQELEKAKSI